MSDCVLDAACQEDEPGACRPKLLRESRIVEKDGAVPLDLERGCKIPVDAGEKGEAKLSGGQEAFCHLAEESRHTVVHERRLVGMALPMEGKKRGEVPNELFPGSRHAESQSRRHLFRPADLPPQFMPLLRSQRREVIPEGGGEGKIRGPVHLLQMEGVSDPGAKPRQTVDRRGPLDEIRQQKRVGRKNVARGGEEFGPEFRLPAGYHDGVLQVGHLLAAEKLPSRPASAQA